MRKAQLEALETQVKAELLARAKTENSAAYPITDGVIDEDQFLFSSPKMLWILKEPWENGGKGDWSVTKQLIPELIAKTQICGHKSYGPMAYVTFSVFNNFLAYAKMRATGNSPKIGESLKNIAYINVSKLPGKSQSVPTKIAAHYRTNRSFLLKQISVINPDVVIGGSTLTLFLDDLGFKSQDFTAVKSLKFCVKDQRLYIDAFHPSQRNGVEWYVDDIVSVIKTHSPVQPPLQS